MQGEMEFQSSCPEVLLFLQGREYLCFVSPRSAKYFVSGTMRQILRSFYLGVEYSKHCRAISFQPGSYVGERSFLHAYIWLIGISIFSSYFICEFPAFRQKFRNLKPVDFRSELLLHPAKSAYVFTLHFLFLMSPLDLRSSQRWV
jgi:hypothetical protein